ncbi:MAG: FecR family protein [Verrucomicrobiales bacterium]|nr:FecR family protein [Verrucomicrobiales bacterium]
MKRTLTTTLVALALAASTTLAATPGEVRLAIGKVTAAPKGSTTFSPVKRGAILTAGTTIKTGTSSRATVVAGTGSSIRISPASTVVLERFGTPAGGKANSPALELKAGTLSALIDRKIEPNSKFQVSTADGIAAARGTIYAVSKNEKGSYTKVRRGKINVRAFSKRPGKRR